MIQVIGDEIHLDGQVVGLLSTTPSASLMGRFRDLLRGGEEARSKTLDDILVELRELAKDGLLHLSDLDTVIDAMKENPTA